MAREDIHPQEIARRSKYLPAESLGTKCRNLGTNFGIPKNFRKKGKNPVGQHVVPPLAAGMVGQAFTRPGTSSFCPKRPRGPRTGHSADGTRSESPGTACSAPEEAPAGCSRADHGPTRGTAVRSVPGGARCVRARSCEAVPITCS